jgi:tetratricopeptide (TPR) repeat protein/predicted transcriptional regulator
MVTNPAAEELLATLAQRRAFLTCILEGEGPTPKQPLIDEVRLSQPTVDKVLTELHDWGLIQSNPDGITPTLLGRMVWITSQDFDQFLATITMSSGDDIPPWSTIPERQEVRELIANRIEVLECVETTPRDKRSLVANLDISRSTVNRALRDLEVIGLVTRTTAGYTMTPVGRQATDQYRTALETVVDILDTRDLLDALPRDYPIQPALLAGAAVEQADETMPYHLPAGVRDWILEADRVCVYLPVLTTPRLLDCCHRGIVQKGVALELLTNPNLFETLTTEFPGPLAAMASDRGGSFTARVADTGSTSLPPFGLVLAETDGSTSVSVIAYGDQQTLQGTLQNDTAPSIQWAEDCYTRARNSATEVTDELRDLAPREHAAVTGNLSAVGDTERVAREAEGFVQLTPEYFTQRAPAPPLTGWRTGFDLVDVHAGYAIDREKERDGSRHNLTTELIEHLGDGANHAVLGSPGSGKSTICRSVACRWYERGIGPVFYRESSTGATFDSPAVLREQLRTAADGRVLVVVEDAVRAEANAIFRVMQAFRGNDNVTFLLDARTEEWDDPEALPPDAGLEAYRNEAIETVTVPPLDDREYERFVRQFEQTTDHDIDTATVQQLREGGIAVTEAQTQEQDRAPVADGPGELLLFLHRLTLYVEPLTVYDSTVPTTLIEEVQHLYEDLQEAGDLALDVGVLVNLLNATGIGVHSELVSALANSDDGINAVYDKLSALEGRLLFDREAAVDAETSPYRTVHEAWSAKFFSHFLDAETEHAAHQRVGRCITALLSLADDEDQRDRITAIFGETTPAIEQIASAPNEWADNTIEQIFSLGLRHRDLAALFGRTDDSAIDLPAACSLSVTVKCTRWRAQMAKEAGNLDRAEHEYECLADFADDIEPRDPEWAATLRGHRLRDLAIIASRRGELETAETYFTRALTYYTEDEENNAQHIAAIRLNLGLVAQQRSEFDTAESSYKQSLDLFRDLGDAQGEAHALHNLAEVVDETGTLETAINYGKRSLCVCREADYHRLEALCLGSLGEFIAARGDFDTAETYATQGLDISRERGLSKAEDYNLDTFGLISQLRGDFSRAETYYQQCLNIHQQTGERRIEARCLRNLSILSHEREAFDTAADRCTKSLKICREIGTQYGEAQSLVVLGEIECGRGDVNTAVEYANESLSLHQEIGAISSTARSRRLLGRIACDREQFTTAEDHLTQALNVFRDTGYRYEEARTLAALGVLARRRDKSVCARERLDTALELYREMGAIRDRIEIGEQLAAVCEMIGDLNAALAHCETAYELALDTEFIEPSTSLIERRNRLDKRRSGDSNG